MKMLRSALLVLLEGHLRNATTLSRLDLVQTRTRQSGLANECIQTLRALPIAGDVIGGKVDVMNVARESGDTRAARTRLHRLRALRARVEMRLEYAEQTRSDKVRGGDA